MSNIKFQIKSKNQKPKTSLKVHRYHSYQGEQKHQLLVVVDKKGHTKGLATREECHKGNGITHLAFMAFILDKNNQITLAQRSVEKSLWAGVWDASVVSHILEGETPESAANRRVKEEMGVGMKFKVIGAFYYFAKHNDDAENEYCFVLIGKTDKNLEPNPVEIEEIKKISIEQLDSELKTHRDRFTPWLRIAGKKLDLLKIL